MRSIVTRLDGLPLAIELAAAKVRAMAIEEIDRRLEDRFALLRGGDRAAPDRHQTLLAVIDWSWNLLDEAERRALRRLALFNDGFTLEAADAVLGDGALDAVQGLVDQSLLSVRDAAGGVRYRMLETVREFGRLQLEAAGEGGEARAARRAWATAYAGRHRAGLFDRDQFATIDALAAEEVNLADELRDALADGDRSALVELLAVLAAFWTIRGEHARLIAVTGAVADAVRDWQPPPELEDTARAALAMTLTNAMATVRPAQRADPRAAGAPRAGRRRPAARPGWSRCCSSTTRRIRPRSRPGSSGSPAIPTATSRCPRSSCSPTRARTPATPRVRIAAAADALALPATTKGRGLAAVLHTRLADLTMHLGDTAAAEEHARAALPVMERLGAMDDVVQLRALLVLCAIAEERLADAAAELERLDAIDERGTLFGGIAFRQIGAAELALARGDVTTGLRLYRECAVRPGGAAAPGDRADRHGAVGHVRRVASRSWRTPTTRRPTPTTPTPARCSRPAASAPCACSTRRTRISTTPSPASRCSRSAPGACCATRCPRDDAVELLVLAERFAYNRMIPTMAWERIAPHAEARAPGRIAALRDGTRRPAAARAARRGARPRRAARRLEVPLVAAHRQRREDRHHDDAGEQRPADLGGDRGVLARSRVARRGGRPG